MLTHLRRSLVLSIISLVDLRLPYAFAGTGVAQLFFKGQADGSITPNGSTLIGQNWAETKCPGHPLGSCVFQGRPDDLGPYSSGSTSPAGHPGTIPSRRTGRVVSPEPPTSGPAPQSSCLHQRARRLLAYGGVNPTPDLVTTSGSGYDPDITPQDATAQIPMVSAATGISPATLQALISKETQGEELGFMGSQIHRCAPAERGASTHQVSCTHQVRCTK